ncbi:MAG: ABC transporter ATP-binding protein/permease [Eubacteriales bacterium]
MLQLTNITKVYRTQAGAVHALRGISLTFRKSEFVSVLGPSGCGKTTLLNIIGGLDKYTAGDLLINGTSSREFRDANWDAYRNHTIGFVFQTYNLIPHQTVLANVELALTLSGVSAAERRRRAVEALEQVGLGDQLSKKPNQMSGGQMQRVAIARALVNNPDILLADEPTGALDTQTSEQVISILKEIAKERLVIMVTHNPTLADRFSTRIIRLVDGQVISDSNPYSPEPESPATPAKVLPRTNRRMSFFTALGLSLNNLLTKKARTIMTSFAGSIGIIGIALILALSSGVQAYIAKVQADTLSSYPLTLEASTMDLSALIASMMGRSGDTEPREEGYVYTDAVLAEMLNAMVAGIRTNDLLSFKQFLESGESDIRDHATIQYVYSITPQVYLRHEDGSYLQVNPSTVMASMSDMMSGSGGGAVGVPDGTLLWDEMLDNEALLGSQYELLDGRWPAAYNEVILVVDKSTAISDMYLYALGLKDPAELSDMIRRVMAGEQVEVSSDTYSYEQLLGLTYHMVLNADYYEPAGDGTYIDQSGNETYMQALLSGDKAVELRVVGIVRPDKDAAATSIGGLIGYTSELTDYLIEQADTRPIVIAQREDPDTDVLTGLPFKDLTYTPPTDAEKASQLLAYYQSLTDAEKQSHYLQAAPRLVMPILMMQAQQDLDSSGLTTKEDKVAHLAAWFAANIELVSANTSLFGEGESIDFSQLKDLPQAQLQVIFNGAFGQMSPAELDEMLLVRFMLPELAPALTAKTAEITAMTPAAAAAAFDAYTATLTEAELVQLWASDMPPTVSDATYRGNLRLLGMADPDSPTAIHLYPVSFDSKARIQEIIRQYNEGKSAEMTIQYTDYIGMIFTSINLILNAITYVLIAFVAISLVVSSIMIGIITYISVLERTKEIGILRAIGASKGDVSRVFNAETVIVGFAAGVMGILTTLVLILPINAIIRALSGIQSLGAVLPVGAAVVLVLISIGLTLIAGLIPSGVAARKDPVVALRSE